MKKMFWKKAGVPANPERVLYIHRSSGRVFGLVEFSHIHKMWRVIRFSANATQRTVIEDRLVGSSIEARKFMRVCVNCY